MPSYGVSSRKPWRTCSGSGGVWRGSELTGFAIGRPRNDRSMPTPAASRRRSCPSRRGEIDGLVAAYLLRVIAAQERPPLHREVDLGESSPQLVGGRSERWQELLGQVRLLLGRVLHAVAGKRLLRFCAASLIRRRARAGAREQPGHARCARRREGQGSVRRRRAARRAPCRPRVITRLDGPPWTRAGGGRCRLGASRRAYGRGRRARAAAGVVPPGSRAGGSSAE
jgi:hypothetical protein